MSELDEALASRRSERMLHEFGLDQLVAEKVWRERMPADDKRVDLYPAEREGLKVLGTMWKERNDR